jgi:hypothetical protein
MIDKSDLTEVYKEEFAKFLEDKLARITADFEKEKERLTELIAVSKNGKPVSESSNGTGRGRNLGVAKKTYGWKNRIKEVLSTKTFVPYAAIVSEILAKDASLNRQLAGKSVGSMLTVHSKTAKSIFSKKKEKDGVFYYSLNKDYKEGK